MYPAEIAKKALLGNASGVVLSHNHPAGTLVASNSDKSITNDVVQALKVLDIRVLDHVIITENGWLSFSQEGLL